MAGGWVNGRLPTAPAGLRERMVRELEAVEVADAQLDASPASASPETRLGEAGMAALARAVEVGGTDRSVAMDLLAADGLLTYACEAAAEGTDPRAGIDAVLSLFRDPVPS